MLSLLPRMNSRRDQIVLIGMMGVGKTTVGRLLAGRLGWDFWDNDEALGETMGETAAQVQRTEGQLELHRVEDELLRLALRTHTRTVFAAAASVVLDPDVLGGALTVWLRASTEREASNLAASTQHHRPLPDEPAAALRALQEQRLPLYTRLADITVDVSADAASTCDLVVGALAARPDIVAP